MRKKVKMALKKKECFYNQKQYIKIANCYLFVKIIKSFQTHNNLIIIK